MHRPDMGKGVEEVCDRIAGRWKGEGAVKGEGKVRDKRLENGIGYSHACHDLSRVIRYRGGCEGSLTLDPLCHCILCVGNIVCDPST